MASFTTTQAAQVRQYLGYPDLFRYQNVRLESILQGNEISSDALTIVANLLTQLAANDAKLFGTGGAAGRAATIAGLRKAESVEFYSAQAIKDWQKLGRMMAGRISIMLGVPIFGDAFDVPGYPGDSYSAGGLTPNGGGGGRGGMFPLG